MDEKTKAFVEQCEALLRAAATDTTGRDGGVNNVVVFVDATRDLQRTVDTIRDLMAEIDRLRPDAEAWRKGWQVLEELRARVIPCGHRIEDLIGGKGSITKCGACLAAKQAERGET